MKPADPGWLAIISTPIGNLEDITLRALRILGEADLIAAEDTRRSRKLLNHFEISTSVTPYHAHNEHCRTESILDQVEGGKKIALLSDAGTPTVSDPGFFIIRAALARGIEPMVVPGASVLAFAVVAAGMPVDRFFFAGFPPVKSGKRRRFLEELKKHQSSCFLFESPYRIPRLLKEIADYLGEDIPVTLIREATKLHEENIRGSAGELAEKYAEKRCKGEFTVALDLR